MPLEPGGPSTGPPPPSLPEGPEESIGGLPPGRQVSFDAYRGLVMFLMMAEVLRFCEVSEAVPGNPVWRFLCHHQSHVEWVGCSLHDLIQPSFTFLVGVVLPFSLAARLARGHAPGRMALHAFWRALALVLLGIFLRSVGKRQTYFTFEDTLTQIGLGYGFLFLIALRPPRVQAVILALILAGTWAAFALYPLPPPGFDYAAVGVPADWPHRAAGFAAHWNKNSNLAWAADTWFLNLFPREKPFVFNGGGYATLSFLPTLGTMIFGLLAGELLRSARPLPQKLRWLVAGGLACVVVGLVLDALGVCPNVKRIWTPTWTIFSAGACLLLLAGFYWIIDVRGRWRWSFPFIVLGLNSITIYTLVHLMEDAVPDTLRTHLGQDAFKAFGPAYEPLLAGAATLLVFWLMMYWMYRRRLFIRI